MVYSLRTLQAEKKRSGVVLNVKRWRTLPRYTIGFTPLLAHQLLETLKLLNQFYTMLNIVMEKCKVLSL